MKCLFKSLGQIQCAKTSAGKVYCPLKSPLERGNWGTCSRPRLVLFHINNFYYCD